MVWLSTVWYERPSARVGADQLLSSFNKTTSINSISCLSGSAAFEFVTCACQRESEEERDKETIKREKESEHHLSDCPPLILFIHNNLLGADNRINNAEKS